MWGKTELKQSIYISIFATAIIPSLIVTGCLYVGINTATSAAIAAAVAIIFAVFCANGIASKYKHNTSEIVKHINNMAEGDFSCVDIHENNSDNAISTELNKLSETLNILITALKDTQATIKKGKLRHRQDTDCFSGAFAELININNDLADTLVGYIDSFPVPAMIVDREFNVQYLNKVGCEIGNIDIKSSCSMKCHDIFQTEDCKSDKCAIGRAMKTGEKCSSETIARPNGMELAISYNASPVKDEAGNIIGGLEIVVDQTEIKKAMEDAQKSVDNMNNLPTPIMTIDTDYNVTYMNPAGAAVMKKTPEQVIGEKCYNLFKTPHCQTPDCRCHKSMMDGKNHTGETVVDPENLNIPIMYTGAPVKDAAGNIVGALEYVVDITDIKECTEENAED